MVGAGRGDAAGGLRDYQNDRGSIGVEHVGRLETKGHPFFEPIGANGRACVMSSTRRRHVALGRTVRERWEATGSEDPLPAVDGMNCPHLPPAIRSHSLLLERGLIRVALPGRQES